MVGVSRPDFSMIPRISKSVILSSTLSGATQYAINFTPQSRVAQCTIYAWSGTAWVASSQVLPDQDLSVDFSQARFTSGILCGQSSTIASGLFAVSGQMWAITYQDLFYFYNLTPNEFIAYKRDDISYFANSPIMQGFACLADPPNQDTFQTLLTNATQLLESGILYQTSLNCYATDNNPLIWTPSPDKHSLFGVSNGSSTVYPVGLPIGLRGRTRVTIQMNASALFPSNQWVPALSVLTDDGTLSTYYGTPIFFSGNFSGETAAICQFEMVINTKFFIMSMAFGIWIAATSSWLDATTLYPLISGTFVLSNDDYASYGNNSPGSFVIIQGVATEQQISLTGVLNYDVVPNAALARNVETVTPVGSIHDITGALDMMHRRKTIGLRAVSTYAEYSELRDKQFEKYLDISRSAHDIGHASIFSDVADFIRPYVRSGMQAMGKVALGQLGNMLGMSRTESERTGFANNESKLEIGYSSTETNEKKKEDPPVKTTLVGIELNPGPDTIDVPKVPILPQETRLEAVEAHNTEIDTTDLSDDTKHYVIDIEKIVFRKNGQVKVVDVEHMCEAAEESLIRQLHDERAKASPHLTTFRGSRAAIYYHATQYDFTEENESSNDEEDDKSRTPLTDSDEMLASVLFDPSPAKCKHNHKEASTNAEPDKQPQHKFTKIVDPLTGGLLRAYYGPPNPKKQRVQKQVGYASDQGEILRTRLTGSYLSTSSSSSSESSSTISLTHSYSPSSSSSSSSSASVSTSSLQNVTPFTPPTTNFPPSKKVITQAKRSLDIAPPEWMKTQQVKFLGKFAKTKGFASTNDEQKIMQKLAEQTHSEFMAESFKRAELMTDVKYMEQFQGYQNIMSDDSFRKNQVAFKAAFQTNSRLQQLFANEVPVVIVNSKNEPFIAPMIISVRPFRNNPYTGNQTAYSLEYTTKVGDIKLYVEKSGKDAQFNSEATKQIVDSFLFANAPYTCWVTNNSAFSIVGRSLGMSMFMGFRQLPFVMLPSGGIIKEGDDYFAIAAANVKDKGKLGTKERPFVGITSAFSEFSVRERCVQNAYNPTPMLTATNVSELMLLMSNIIQEEKRTEMARKTLKVADYASEVTRLSTLHDSAAKLAAEIEEAEKVTGPIIADVQRETLNAFVNNPQSFGTLAKLRGFEKSLSAIASKAGLPVPKGEATGKGPRVDVSKIKEGKATIPEGMKKFEFTRPEQYIKALTLTGKADATELEQLKQMAESGLSKVKDYNRFLSAADKAFKAARKYPALLAKAVHAARTTTESITEPASRSSQTSSLSSSVSASPSTSLSYLANQAPIT